MAHDGRNNPQQVVAIDLHFGECPCNLRPATDEAKWRSNGRDETAHSKS